MRTTGARDASNVNVMAMPLPSGGDADGSGRASSLKV
jgi:hypothetical protein